ncbi:glycosyl transferase family 1 [Candidatus Woesearchaeota archaeon B3_Woes]|nr:MAG: glycosyl transferase family 1 [Candidatus Woesearchaeota archaeon B3_Woes]
MKICVVGPAYPFKGGIAHYNNWLCNFVSKKHDLKCISFKRLYPKLIYPGKSQKDLSAENRTNFEIIELLDSLNPFSWLFTFKKIKEYNPDFILFYWWTPYFTFLNKFLTWNIKKKLNSKIIYLCHNVLPHEKSTIDKILSKFALKDGNFFVVHADKEKQNLQKLLPSLNSKSIISTVHPSYDVQFKFKEISKREAQKKIKISGKIILFFGYVRDYKGLMYLIDAMPHILKEVDLTLLIVGEFWKDKKIYIERIKKTGAKKNIRVVDKYIPDNEVGYYYSASDLVVLPYLSATNSGIIQIAFGFGKPVITTNVGGLPEIVKNNKTGFVVPPKNSIELANKIVKYYKEEKEKPFKQNIKKEKERFSWNRMVETIGGLSNIK